MRPVYAISGGVSKFAKARPDKTFQAVIKEAYDYAIDDIGLDFPTFTRMVDGSVASYFSDHFARQLMAGIMAHDYLGLCPKPSHRVEGGGAASGYTYPNPRGHDMYSGEETKWIDITNVPARVHTFTVCYFGSEEFLPECPFVLALIEFEGVNTLLLTRLMGVDPASPSLDWIGTQVTPHFLRNSKLKPTDVYFSLAKS